MIVQAKRSSGTLLRSRNESSKKYQAVYQHIFRTGNYPMLLNLLHLTAMINSHLQKRTRHNLSYTALWLDSNVIIFHKITLQFCERYQRQVSTTRQIRQIQYQHTCAASYCIMNSLQCHYALLHYDSIVGHYALWVLIIMNSLWSNIGCQLSPSQFHYG